MIKPSEFEEWPEVYCKDGKYRPSLPLPDFFSRRLKDAWAVLQGRALALKLYDGSESED